MDRNKIPVEDFLNKIKQKGATIDAFNALKTGEEDVPLQLAEMKQEKKEKELLAYQLKRKVGDVNAFLLSKYSDGNFNEAIINGYDNSENRIANSITYEYHVYYPKSTIAGEGDEYKEYRPPSDYVITKPIFSSFGDKYIYHIPIRRGLNNNGEPKYITDMNETLRLDGVSESKNGLVYALDFLSKKIKDSDNRIPNDVYQILRNHQFINKNGKLDLAVPNKAVEKYILNYMPTKKKDVIEYLNKEFKVGDKDVKADEIKVDDVTNDTANLSPQQIKDNYDTSLNLMNIEKDKAMTYANGEYKDFMNVISDNADEEVKKQIELINREYEESIAKLDGKNVIKNQEIIAEFIEKAINDAKKKIADTKAFYEEIHDRLYADIDGEKPAKIDYNYGIEDEGKYKEWLLEQIKKWKDDKKKFEEGKKEEEDRKAKEAEKAKKEEEEDRKAKEAEKAKKEEEEDQKAKEKKERKEKEKAKKEEEERKRTVANSKFEKAKEIVLKEYKELLNILVKISASKAYQDKLTANITTINKKNDLDSLLSFFNKTNITTWTNARKVVEKSYSEDISDEYPILKSGTYDVKAKLEELLKKTD